MSSREGTPEPTSIKKDIKEEEEEESKVTEKEEKVVDPEDIIDMNTFEQLLDMDDEDDHEFSLSIVLDYFVQVEQTFEDMDTALKNKDLHALSRSGHFLKGSSAAIGLKKVKATCEKIQNIGTCYDETEGTLEEDEALKRMTLLLPQVKVEHSEAKEYLKKFYETY